MLSIAHTIIALPFALYLENPVIVFVAAFTSHLLADTLPHWNIYYENYKRFPVVPVAADVIGGLVLAWALVGNQILTTPVLFAIAGSNAPDVLHGLWEVAGKPRVPLLNQFFAFHDNIQLETKDPLPGLVAQITLMLLAVYIVRM